MKSCKFILVFFILVTSSETNAEKRWDGEANDGQWSSPLNWYPDGIPFDTDFILLNNDFIKSGYHIKIPSSANSISCSRITIMPSDNNKITLEIPETNTASPAFVTDTIIIHKGGELLNCSGALAGNTFQINGNMVILNDGRYIHQTIRGNAYLISKLNHYKGTEKGIFVFNVPGSTGYLVSLSGRTFGTLQLSKNSLAQSKSYNGIGSNDLVISGDFIIDSNVNFKSTLTGNYYINGDLRNNGNFYVEPASSDTSKRKIIFNGDTTDFINNGNFEQNEHFNGITISTKAILKLKSALTIKNPNATVLVSTSATFDPGEYYVEGGKFYSDSASVLLISSINGISSQTNKGSIRTGEFRINPKSMVVFYGEGNQESGDLFPDTLAAIMIKKTQGNLRLSKNIHITDSIILMRGNIISSSNGKISFSGRRILPIEMINDKDSYYSGFIDGPFTYYSDSSYTINFPIGKDGIYAPMQINNDIVVPITYEIEYFNLKSTKYDSLKIYPLYSIDSTQYWDIEIKNQPSATEIKSSISLKTNINEMADKFKGEFVAYYENESGKWVGIPKTSFLKAEGMNTSIPFTIKNGQLTYGQLRLDPLPFVELTANASLINNMLEVTWKNIIGNEIINYRIEASCDAKKFMVIEHVNNHALDEGLMYKYKFKLTEPTYQYVRICAIDKNHTPHYSNIIHFKNDFQMHKIFPNPATNEIYLVANQNEQDLEYWISDAAGKVVNVPGEKRKNIYKFRIENLSPGYYILHYALNDIHQSHVFIKK